MLREFYCDFFCCHRLSLLSYVSFCEITAQNETFTQKINQCFQSVSDGKTAVATALTKQGVATANDATFATMASNVTTAGNTRYNNGYSAGVTAADNRANANSVNYKTGYNAGVVAANSLCPVPREVYQNYRQLYNGNAFVEGSYEMKYKGRAVIVMSLSNGIADNRPTRTFTVRINGVDKNCCVAPHAWIQQTYSDMLICSYDVNPGDTIYCSCETQRYDSESGCQTAMFQILNLAKS